MQMQQPQMGIVEGEDWIVRSAEQEALITLPKRLKDGEVIRVVEFVQRIEKAAFDEGRKLAQGAMDAAQRQRILAQQDRIQSLEAHNTLLAEKLEQTLNGDSPNGDD